MREKKIVYIVVPVTLTFDFFTSNLLSQLLVPRVMSRHGTARQTDGRGTTINAASFSEGRIIR